MSQVIERVRLTYRAGRSDKIYEIELIAEGEGLFHVVGYNGRRGAQLVAQPKTRAPVPFATARRIFDQLEQAKLNHRKTPYRIADRQVLQANQNSDDSVQRENSSPSQQSKEYYASRLDALEL
jgi:hypothetical protein